ncbi:MAG: 50S ribosomal protein L29 [Patescibacteria group bacterium]|mgnify:FL=1
MDFKDKKDSELQKELYEKRKALRLFRFGIAGSKIKNVKEGRVLRKDIARIMTELNSRSAGQA